MLVVKSFTAIAKRTTPKTFRMILIPDFPRIRSICLEDLRMIYTKRILIRIAKMILITSYSALKESKEVIVPAPAIIGKARGTMEAVSGISSLYKLIPKIISSAKKRITKDPATAKELMSIPISLRISSPKNKKLIIMIAETTEAFSD